MSSRLADLKIKVDRVCARCSCDKNIPIDMSRRPRETTCDECQQRVKTYSRRDGQ